MMVIKICFALLILGMSNVYGYNDAHSYFTIRNICSIESKREVRGHYTIFKLKCDWYRFVDSINDANRNYLNSHSDLNDNFYDIEFVNTSKLVLEKTSPKYTTIMKDLFKNFNLKMLSIRNLNIEKIETDAFSNEKESIHLEVFDLSFNRLRRIDSGLLRRFQSLEKLILSNNQLSFDEKNFESLKGLKYLDISNNNLQYLTPNLFSKINRLEYLDLSNNNLESISLCLLSQIQTHPISLRYSPPLINLNKNPIDCDCAIFFLNRHLGFRLNLTCSKPKYYNGIDFNQLNLEDPSLRCNYESIEESCKARLTTKREMILIITLSIITLLFSLCTCCCCCKFMAQSNKIERLREALNLAKSEQKTKKVYLSNTIDENNYQQASGDREKLIA